MTGSHGETDDVAPDDSQRVPLSALGELNRLAALGIDSVEQRLERLDDYDATAESTTTEVGYLDTAAVDRLAPVERVGARVRLRDAPYGYAVVLFPVESANNAAALMLSNTLEAVEEASPEMAESALTELGGIAASGYLDAWAREFDLEIPVSEPEFLHNSQREILTRTAAEPPELGASLASGLVLPEHGIEMQVYFLPEDGALVELLGDTV